MKKICKELLKENNKREEDIYSDNNEVYTDMIVYLRGSDMSEYNQELVRADLIEMILDGQQRGDDIKKVIGSNYKEICDEIIATMPKKTRSEKLISSLNSLLSITWILGIIHILKTIIMNLVSGEKNSNFTLSIVDIISFIIIVVIANIVVKYVCNNAFENKKENKILSFIKYWIISMIFLLALFIIRHYFNYIIVNVSLILASVVVGIIFILERITSLYTV